MERFVFLLLSAVILPLFPLSAFAANKPVTLGFVYVSPANEASWAHSHDLARQALAAMPGVKTMYKESVPEGHDAEEAIRKMARKGCDIVFTTSFGYMDPTIKVAKEFPDVTFLHCSGFKTAPNVSTYFARIYQARFLIGMAAGAMTKKNVIGYAAAFPIPEVIRGINAFTLGTRSVNPDATVNVMWTLTWYDETKKKNTVLQLIDAGADVIAQHRDSPAPQQATEERGVYSVGFHTDMNRLAPNAHLVAAVWNWTPFYTDVLEKVRDGTWKTSQHWPGLESGIVGLSDFGPMVPQDVRGRILERKDAIMRGKFAVFTGPIADQNGRIRIKEGERASDKELLDINWFVRGVTGVDP